LDQNYEKLARYYDIIHSDLTADIDFTLSLAARQKLRIMELGCGTGRLLLPLARAGHTVLGVDRSSPMLELAREKIRRERDDVRSLITLVETDMTLLNLGRLFDMVILSHNTLHELLPAKMGPALDRCAAHLEIHGQLVLDLANPFITLRETGDFEDVIERTFLDPSTGHLVSQFSRIFLDPSGQSLQVDWTFETIGNSSHSREQFTVQTRYHLVYAHELELLLDDSGFQLVKLLGGYGGETFEEKSDRMIAIARLRPKE
jgi:SAM-dependent methyltransferase